MLRGKSIFVVRGREGAVRIEKQAIFKASRRPCVGFYCAGGVDRWGYRCILYSGKFVFEGGRMLFEFEVLVLNQICDLLPTMIISE